MKELYLEDIVGKNISILFVNIFHLKKSIESTGYIIDVDSEFALRFPKSKQSKFDYL